MPLILRSEKNQLLSSLPQISASLLKRSLEISVSLTTIQEKIKELGPEASLDLVFREQSWSPSGWPGCTFSRVLHLGFNTLLPLSWNPNTFWTFFTGPQKLGNWFCQGRSQKNLSLVCGSRVNTKKRIKRQVLQQLGWSFSEHTGVWGRECKVQGQINLSLCLLSPQSSGPGAGGRHMWLLEPQLDKRCHSSTCSASLCTTLPSSFPVTKASGWEGVRARHW